MESNDSLEIPDWRETSDIAVSLRGHKWRSKEAIIISDTEIGIYRDESKIVKYRVATHRGLPNQPCWLPLT